MKTIVLVDVDLSVVDSLTPWLEWYKKLTGHNLDTELSRDKNNVEELMKSHDDPMEYWRRTDLYDDLEPMGDCVRILEELVKDHNCKIVFVSACHPSHEKSKRMFLQRNFKFEYEFVSTSDKGAIRCDYAIDDFRKYLHKIQIGNPDAHMLHIKTDLNSRGEYDYVNWREIREIIIEGSKNEK